MAKKLNSLLYLPIDSEEQEQRKKSALKINRTQICKNNSRSREYFFNRFKGPIYYISNDLKYLEWKNIIHPYNDDYQVSLNDMKVGELGYDQYLEPILSNFIDSDMDSYSWVCSFLKENSTIWMEMTAIKVPEDRSILLYGNNISRRQKVLEDLKDIEDAYYSAIETVPVAITQVDSNLNIIKSNSFLHKLLATFKISKIKSFKEVIDKQSLKTITSWMKFSNNQAQANLSLELNLVNNINQHLKTKYWIQLKASLLNPTDKIFTFVIQDITSEKQNIEELKCMHKRLRHVEKMSALGEMSAGLAHEMNNPLAIINGNLSIISEELKSNQMEKEKLAKAFQTISKTATRINEVVKGLSGYSKPDERRENHKINIHEIFESLAASFNDSLKKQNIEFECKTTGEQKEITGYYGDIYKALGNIFQNAIDATQETSESKKWIKLQIEFQKNYAHLKISDSGLGITGRNKLKIFEPFFTTKEIGQGTGLGLSYASGIIEGMGGSIILDEDSDNTTFLINLPYQNLFFW